MAFESRIKVRFGDEDHAQIVYYPRFFHFFHCAFEDFFDAHGFRYRDCLDVDRVGWPAVHAEADFARPVRFGETLVITLEVVKLGDKSVTFAYRGQVDGEEVEACRGAVTVVCVSMDSFEGCAIPDRYRALFESHRRV